MSKKTHSQDSNSDPRNEEDYDTWEYGTEPIPFEEVWRKMEEIEPLTPIVDYKQAYLDAAKADEETFGKYDATDAYRES